MRSILDKLFQAKGSPMGLDISPDCVRMIQLSCRGEQFCVEGPSGSRWIPGWNLTALCGAGRCWRRSGPFWTGAALSAAR